jgi:hypothetical protein
MVEQHGAAAVKPKLEIPICQVPGCGLDLSALKMYYQRCKICENHHRAVAIAINNRPSRFCQQCAALQPVSAFDGERRSCRAALERHNARRQRKSKVGPETGTSHKFPTNRIAAHTLYDLHTSQVAIGATVPIHACHVTIHPGLLTFSTVWYPQSCAAPVRSEHDIVRVFTHIS